MTDIAELFSRDPLTYTKEGGEVRAIVEHMRKSRHQFNLGSMNAGRTKAPTSAKGKAVASLAASGLSLNLKALLGQNEDKK